MITVVLNFPSNRVPNEFVKAVAVSPVLTLVLLQASGLCHEALEAIQEGAAAVREAERIVAGKESEESI